MNPHDALDHIHHVVYKSGHSVDSHQLIKIDYHVQWSMCHGKAFQSPQFWTDFQIVHLFLKSSGLSTNTVYDKSQEATFWKISSIH